jgi:histidine ammonia-lyase
MELHLTPGHMTLADLRRVYQQPARVTLDPAAAGPIEASVACVERIIDEGRTAYGINTGFGLLARTWKPCRVRWCCRTRPEWARRWTTRWCG